jgi:kynurenine formamidase
MDDALSTADLDGLFDRLCQWGRWGPEDERGSLNHLTAERTAAAAATVTEGRVLSLAHDLALSSTAEHYHPAEHRMLSTGDQRHSHRIAGYEASHDYIGTDVHGTGLTHIDALSHMFVQGRMYNDLPASLVTTEGALRTSVMSLADGVVGRGVLLDVPGARDVPFLDGDAVVTVADLEAAEERQQCHVGPGDLVAVSTGRDVRRARAGRPLSPLSDGMAGLDPRCLDWLAEREPAVLGSDGISDRMPMQPSDRWPFPIHQIAITAMGLHLVDSLRLDALAALCATLGRWTFLLTIAVLRIPGGTGCPVNPIALF